MIIDFATYCCHKDVDKLIKDFDEHLGSHNYNFNSVHVIYQRIPVKGFKMGIITHYIDESEYDDILRENGINPHNDEADEYTHGWTGAHYWKHHCVNQLTALKVSHADYIVLSDADCHMVNKTNWIEKGIDILRNNPDILVVSPSDGSDESKTQNMSQQLFLCERQRLALIDFDLPFEGFRDGGPMQEYYFMLEGRIGRYMEKNGLYRHILPINYRYWHKQWH